ncbi:MAG: thioredoxin family protein [Bacteroidales bacterium]|nr:thioredoxin family protein [Bacteroidales bacterium]
MSKAITIQSLTGLMHHHQAVLLYFYSDQCAPCISLRPKVEELIVNDFPEMKLQMIDSQKFQKETANFGVFTFPTLIVFFEGKEFRRYSKYVSLMQLSDDISRPYSMLFEANN